MKTSNMFLIALGGVAVGYLAVNEYRRYKFAELKKKALDPANATAVREVFETIGSHSPATGESVVTVAQGAGLPSCDQMFQWKPDGFEPLRQMLISGSRAIGKCK